MCGICGFSIKGQKPEFVRSTLKGMCDTMVHRGPDDWGIHFDTHMAIGMRRLSIIDLVTGHQPYFNEDKSICMVYNGEIYNFHEIKEGLLKRGHKFSTRSDGEVILHLYEEKGERFVDDLNGMYGIALWDEKERQLTLARDRLGIKPLYYLLNQEGNIAFASELKALLKYPLWEPKLDIEALDLYLTYEYVPTPKSIYKGVSKLPPGNILIYKEGNLQLREYWDFDYSHARDDEALNEQVCMEAYLELLEKSVKRRLISDVPLGTFLSGGIDSSLVTALAHRNANYPIESFQIGFNEPSFDETPFATLAAGHIGIKHNHRMFSPSEMLGVLPQVCDVIDEPLGDASLLPTFLLCKFCRESVTVALSGDGGDELFAGYPTYFAHKMARYYLMLPGIIREGLIEPLIRRLPVSDKNLSFDFKAKRFITGIDLPQELRHTLWMGSFCPNEKYGLFLPDIRRTLGDHDAFEIARNHIRRSKTANPLHAILYLDAKLYLQDDLLVKVDRASMANSLEVRVPVLDHICVDYATCLPTVYKLKGLKSKYLLKQVASSFLPKKIVNRPKKGFGIPVAKWIRSDIKELFLDTLSPDKIRREGLFNPEFISGMMRDHLTQRIDYRKPLWTLFMFEQWLSRWL